MITIDIDLDNAKGRDGRLVTLMDDDQTTKVNLYLTPEGARQLKEAL
ncbi:MAG: hypothetical protein HOV97_05780 [Nonomuraea sp.]|nr:hypothetical protein [Nonomuraea sp.]